MKIPSFYQVFAVWPPARVFHLTIVSALVMIISVPGRVDAQRLPSMDDGRWLGFLSGYIRQGFEFGVNNEGLCELHLLNTNTKKRVGQNRTIKIYAQVVDEDEQGKPTTRRFKRDEGFVTDVKPGLEHTEVKFMAETSAHTKVEILVKYDRDRIIMDGRVLDPGKLQGKHIYLNLVVRVPAMYGPSYRDADEKKVKSRMRKDRVRFTRAKDKKRVSMKSYGEAVLDEKGAARGGVTKVVAQMSGQKGNTFVFTTLDGKGVLAFENFPEKPKGPLWRGYLVKWKRVYSKDDKDNKDSAKKSSPLVIEIKG